MNRALPFHSSAVWPPPPLLVGLFIFIYAIVTASFWLIELSVPLGARMNFDDTGEIVTIRAAILGCAAGVYAAFRLWRFHPACNPGYAAWLRLSPWTAAKPLPLGPVCLVWQDAVVMGVLTVIAYGHAHVDPALPVTVFGFVYLGGLTFLLAFTRRWWHCLALGFLWPALMLPSVAGTPGFALIAAIIVVVWHGHAQSLKTFPWAFVKDTTRPAGSVLQLEIRLEVMNGTSPAGAPYNLGWPFLALSPKIRPRSISNRSNLALSTLLGWWSYCVIESSKMNPVPELILFLAILAAIFRLVIYGSGVAPPFNLWGRFASGRIIVPGFDKVFLTPLAAVLAAILGVIIIKRSGPSYPVAESCAIAAICYVLFGGGPTLRKWMLTGHHRLRPPARQNAKREMLRPV
jgi:hypothetical protein